MHLALYAPLKSPGYPVPSGDREIARRLLDLLEQSGHMVELASQFRAYEGRGDPDRQHAQRLAGLAQADALARRWAARAPVVRPALWLTYHLYHKAPDWIGPTVCARLGIPYVVVEASVAAKQAGGPWSIGYQAALDALGAARAIITLNSHDIEGLRSALGPDAPIRMLRPFLDAERFRPANPDLRAGLRREWASGLDIDKSAPWLLTVAMMRPGNKLASFQVLAKALEQLDDANWYVLIAGDGTARQSVEAAFASVPASRVRFLGQRGQDDLISLMQASDLFAWPAVDEPIGMAMLEAQACGLPVVAARVRGVGDVVGDGLTGLLAEEGDHVAFAKLLRQLLNDGEQRYRLGRQAREQAVTRHGLPAARSRLSEILDSVSGDGR